jgi:SOS-response transcriptional repressor LexA
MHVIEETETVSLDEYLVKNKEATYMLRVVGHNLNEHGVYEGDMLLVERGRVPRIGDMAVTWSSTGFIMKKYTIENGTESIRAEAVVIAVVRKYG